MTAVRTDAGSASLARDPSAPDLPEHLRTAPPLAAVQSTRYARYGKPIFDRVVVALLFPLALPVLAVVALAVRLSLDRPILFRQTRIGLNGEPFDFIKFRSMRPDRREQQTEFQGPDRRQTHKSDADPRHTAVGRFLRRTTLDELPQLWHVFKGDMSLVGPRPELASVIEASYQPWQHQRHLVKPGITGLWQVTARSSGRLMLEDVAIDIEYLRQQSFLTDLKILLATPKAILRP